MEPLSKLRLPLDCSKCHLFYLLIIHTTETLPHGMVQPITTGSKICIKVVVQMTHINPCKQEIVPQEK